jgi:tellurium resistance protein TerZ
MDEPTADAPSEGHSDTNNYNISTANNDIAEQTRVAEPSDTSGGGGGIFAAAVDLLSGPLGIIPNPVEDPDFKLKPSVANQEAAHVAMDLSRDDPFGYLPRQLYADQGDIRVGLSWELCPNAKVDLDASAVCFTSTGVVADAVYYNCLTACNGCITHSGDCKDGSIEGYDEVITINLERIVNCQAIVIVLSASSGGTLKDCESAMVEVTQSSQVLQSFPCIGPHTGNNTSLLLGMFYKDYGTHGWLYKTIFAPVPGRQFSTSIREMRNIVDTILDPNMVGERLLSHDKTFQLSKNSVVQLPADVRHLQVGLGWTTPSNNLDLDASCVMLTDSDTVIGQYVPADVVYFGEKIKLGVQSMGDNMSGVGEGDDECIKINLDQVPPQCVGLAFVVNIYSSGRSFTEVQNSYIRLIDPKNNHEYTRFTLDNSLKTSSVLFCLLSRDRLDTARWDLTALGQDCGSERTIRQVQCHLWEGTWGGNSRFQVPPTKITDVDTSGCGDGCCAIC